MKTIHKFALGSLDSSEIKMPVGAEILHVGEQQNAIFLWALVDTGMPLESRYFHVFGTGHEIPMVEMGVKERKYLGTSHLYDGNYIMHVFETIPL